MVKPKQQIFGEQLKTSSFLVAATKSPKSPKSPKSMKTIISTNLTYTTKLPSDLAFKEVLSFVFLSRPHLERLLMLLNPYASVFYAAHVSGKFD